MGLRYVAALVINEFPKVAKDQPRGARIGVIAAPLAVVPVVPRCEPEDCFSDLYEMELISFSARADGVLSDGCCNR